MKLKNLELMFILNKEAFSQWTIKFRREKSRRHNKSPEKTIKKIQEWYLQNCVNDEIMYLKKKIEKTSMLLQVGNLFLRYLPLMRTPVVNVLDQKTDRIVEFFGIKDINPSCLLDTVVAHASITLCSLSFLFF